MDLNQFLLDNYNDGMMQIYTANLNTVISNLDHYIPQYSRFINDVIAVQVKYNVIVHDSLGYLSIDVPETMSQAVQDEVSKKIRILDNLCSQRSIEIESELDKGKSIEDLIRKIRPNYTSRISGQIAEYARLQGAFK